MWVTHTQLRLTMLPDAGTEAYFTRGLFRTTTLPCTTHWTLTRLTTDTRCGCFNASYRIAPAQIATPRTVSQTATEATPNTVIAANKAITSSNPSSSR